MTSTEDGGLQMQSKESTLDIVPLGNSRENLENSNTCNLLASLTRYCGRTMDLVNHVLIVAITTILLYFSLQSFSNVNIHVALCTVGYVLLMSEAIAVLAGENVLTKSLTRRAKSHIHWILQVLGLIFSVSGVVILYQVKREHFKSIHGITGIASVVSMCFLTVFGYPVLVAAKLRKLLRPVVIKFSHNLLGILCFAVGIVSQCYGYKKHWLKSVSNDVPYIQLIFIILTSITTILSLRGALLSLFRQTVALFR